MRAKNLIINRCLNLPGLGFSTAKRILVVLGLPIWARITTISGSSVEKLVNLLRNNFLSSTDFNNIKFRLLRDLKLSGSYRGLRHIQGLPTRGQRTRSNARVAKKVLGHSNYLSQSYGKLFRHNKFILVKKKKS